MPINDQQDREVAFISGVNAKGTVAATSYYTMLDGASGTLVPAQYGSLSSAIKWGSGTPGTAGGVVQYWFADASGWTNTEKTVWEGSFAFWSGIANIDFQLAASAADANITVVRGTDGQAHASFAPHGTVPVGGST